MSKKKSVLITGCSDGGIGGALALTFQALGFHVFATARNMSKMSAVANLPNVTLLTLDVLDATQIAAAVEAVKQQTGPKLDILINNSGENFFFPILDSDLFEAKRIFDINFWAPFNIIKAFAPLLIEAKGIAASIYAASKRSLEIVSDHLRVELEPFGVKVVSVVTGAVDTNGNSYFDEWKLPEDSIYKPAEKIIGARARGNDGVKRMDRSEYANKVASEIIRGASSKIWCGSHAGGVKFGECFVPQSILDSQFIKGCGLEQLGKKT
ncbi:hypothetical protein G7Y89_g3980 [Cudoniella acicularis]|uniref:Uncharacterized protein n=1 Tax=Cudoniella acicularis TaxID=354080 RepID=A0A8H4RSF2_9HELO|nr:hypothetical protein G7Y89_g3980 [Cudoniella acicularis]